MCKFVHKICTSPFLAVTIERPIKIAYSLNMLWLGTVWWMISFSGSLITRLITDFAGIVALCFSSTITCLHAISFFVIGPLWKLLLSKNHYDFGHQYMYWNPSLLPQIDIAIQYSYFYLQTAPKHFLSALTLNTCPDSTLRRLNDLLCYSDSLSLRLIIVRALLRNNVLLQLKPPLHVTKVTVEVVVNKNFNHGITVSENFVLYCLVEYYAPSILYLRHISGFCRS